MVVNTTITTLALAHIPSVKDGLKYASSHEWVKVDGGVATVGVSDHAQASVQL